MVNLPASSLNHLTSASLAQGGSNAARPASQNLAEVTAQATENTALPRNKAGSGNTGRDTTSNDSTTTNNRNDTATRSRATSARDSDTPSFKTLLKPHSSSTTTTSQQDASEAPPASTSADEPVAADAVVIPVEPTPQPNTAITMAFLLQLQSQPLQPVPAANADSMEAPTASTSASSVITPTETADSASLDELMQQLSALLSQMLNAGAAPVNSKSTAATETTATTEPVQPVDGKEPATKTPEELVALILAMLQGAGAPPATTNAQAALPSSTTAIADITANIQDSSPQPTLAELLTQLASTLSTLQKEGNVASTADDTETKDSQTDASPSFLKAIAQADTITPEALKPIADTSDLQQLVNKALYLLDAQKGQTDPKFIEPKALDTKLIAAVDATAQTQPVAAPTLTPATQTQEAPKAAHVHAPVRPDLPVLEQVVVQVKNAASDGSSQIRIKLNPEDMGQVDVQMTTNAEGKTSITISSDNRNTLALLQNEARSLQDALRDIGLKTDAGGLSFNLRDSGQDARNSNHQSSSGYTKVAAVEEEENFGFSTTGSLYRISVQQGLDISV